MPEGDTLFRTAHEIPPEWHVRIQAAFQAHTDNAVSKTVNLARDVSPAVIADAIERAWRSRLKGVTLFREGCRGDQVLTAGGVPRFAVAEEHAEAHAEYAGDCRICSV